MSAAVAAALRAARGHLVEFGWQQGKQGGHGEPCCAMGAITAAVTSGDVYHGARDALAAQLVVETGKRWIADWNDAPGRTFAEVLDLLDKAIAAEEARP